MILHIALNFIWFTALLKHESSSLTLRITLQSGKVSRTPQNLASMMATFFFRNNIMCLSQRDVLYILYSVVICTYSDNTPTMSTWYLIVHLLVTIEWGSSFWQEYLMFLHLQNAIHVTLYITRRAFISWSSKKHFSQKCRVLE